MKEHEWLEIDQDNGYSIDHLPLGIDFSGVVTRVGDTIIQLSKLTDSIKSVDQKALSSNSLNHLFSLGHKAMENLREEIVEITREATKELLSASYSFDHARLKLPVQVGNFVDFYSSLHHATNVGRLFRPNADPLPKAWRHLPIAYHGRSSTVLPSGTKIVRPKGLLQKGGDVVFSETGALDFEAEVGFIVAKESEVGTPLSPSEFYDYVAGVVLVNDWSARDIQAFEYVPLGPFLGKSFATSMSCLVTPIEALLGARVQPVRQDPTPSSYLFDPDPWALDIGLSIKINQTAVSSPPFRSMYWTPGQQLAHMTINGANVTCGDVFASGTVSGENEDQVGSLIELTQDGRRPITLVDGTSRSYLDDGDVVTISATTRSLSGGRLSFGEVIGEVLPSL